MAAPMPALHAPDPPLTDGTITLRDLRHDDAALVSAALADPEIPRWTRVPVPYTEADWHEWVEDAGAQATLGIGLHLLIVDAEDRPLGSVGVNEIDWDRGTGDIGYWVAREARGRGVCTRGVCLLTAWLLAGTDLRLIEILVHHENAPSRAVARAAGYAETGEQRGCARMGHDAADFVVHRYPAETGA